MELKTTLIGNALVAILAMVGAAGCGGADPQSDSSTDQTASTSSEALASGARLWMVDGGWLRNDANRAIAWIPPGGWVTFYSGSLRAGVVVNWRGMVGHAWGPYFSTSPVGVGGGGG